MPELVDKWLSKWSPRTVLVGVLILSALPLLIVEMFPRLLKFVMQPAAYLVFHNTAEFFSIMVSLSMFGISWYTYEQSKNRHALFLGTAFLAIGIVDFMHAMSMPAMPDFITPNDPQKSVQFWIPVRLFQAVAFLASAYVYPDKPIRWLSKRILIASSLLVSSLVFTGIIFFQSHMPTFFVWGVGVTPLKKFCEYLVIFLLCAATGAYWRRMEITGDRLLIYYLAAFVVSIFSELPLAFYARAFDTYNVLGHINKIIAFFLIYYGIYRASVKDPYIRLAEIGQGLKREVAERKRTEEALQKSQEELEKRVEERTGDLQRANATLKAEIAERKRLEEELIESEEKSRLLIKYAPSMLYEIDFHRPAFKSVNDAMCQFMGYTREELLAMNPFDLLDEEGKALFRERIRRKLAGEAISDSVEYKSKTKDGREVHGALNISFTEKDGKPAGAVVVAHDITERKQMEAAIRRQNAVLQGINRIFEETLKSQTEEDLAKVYLNVAEEVTESKFGFIGEIGQDGLLHDIAISNPGWELCTMVDKTGHRRPPGDFKMHGLYGRVLQDGKSLFANTPGEHPDSIGTPAGHPQLDAFLGVPLVRDGRIIGMMAVGNREGGYGPKEVEALEALAVAIVESFSRMRAEQALRESEQRLRSLSDNIPSGAIYQHVLQPDRRVRYAYMSAGIEKILGMTAGQVMADPDAFRKLIVEEDGPRCAAAEEKSLREWSTYDCEFRQRTVAGEIKWVHCQSTPRRMENGSVLWDGVVVDVTARKQAEQALHHSQARFKLLSDTAWRLLATDNPQGIVNELCQNVMAHLNCHAFFNFLVEEKARRLHLNACAGIPKEEARKIEWLDYGVAVCGCVARDGVRIVAEDIFNIPDPRTDLVKSYGIQAYACHPLRIGDRLIGTLSFGTKTRKSFSSEDLALMRTVTDQVATAMERMRLVKELRRSRDELEMRVQERTAELKEEIARREKAEQQLLQTQKLESIGTLAGGIAHDFNNILGAIVINSEMALFDLPRGSDLRSNLELILSSGIRGKDLVRQMLLFSRKSEKKQEILTLTPLIKETFKLLRSSLPTTIQMKLNLETESDAVYADPSQIQQVIMNLCTNAAYAMRGTMGSIDICLQTRAFGSNDLPEADMEPGDYLVLSVKDTGSGMEEKVKKRIFEPFFTTKPTGEGTGLGLSVVYGIVKSHKGNITVYSEPGRGSIFRVYLPKADTGVSVPTENPRPIPKGNERILFIDDEEIIVNSVQNMLQHLGYQVTALKDSQEALKLFSADPSQFDLVMTDQTMPFMTGEDLGKEMMRLRPDIPVILCTGYSDLISSEKATTMGFRGYIMKPFTVREGAELVRYVLDQDRSK